MKILFPVPDPNRTVNNHYVYSLCDALNEQGMNAVCTLKDFWTDQFFDFDIIHFQWPETLFRWKVCHTQEELERLDKRLLEFKSKRKKVFLTCHNLHPHEIKDSVALKLYDVLYKYTDVFVHMGEYSRAVLRSEYPQARHVVIPHHIYDNVYSMDISKENAKEQLGLSQNKITILSFGVFRNDAEREMLMEVRSKMQKQNAEFLAPGFYRQKLLRRPLILLPQKIYKRIYYRLRGIKFCNSLIPDKDLPVYFCAADIVLIQRLEILNSGNLAMAFHAGKMVVGPDTGNVGPILKNTGNIIFDPKRLESVSEALSIAINSDYEQRGLTNREYALETLASAKVAEKLSKEYHEN